MAWAKQVIYGFTQCEWDVGHDKNGKGGDGHGWTVGGWSITQKGNFKMLGEKYMPKYDFSSDICQILADSDPGNGIPSQGKINEIVIRLTNKNGGNDRNTDVVNFIHATSDMFAHTWYASYLALVNKYGFKTRLGLATIIRAIGWTHGNMELALKTPLQQLLAHGAYAGKGDPTSNEYKNKTINDLGANIPFGDEEKEKKFLKIFWEGHAARGRVWIKEANSYLNVINSGNLNPDSLSIRDDQSVITYGQLIPSYAKYQDIFMPYLREIGSPIILGSENTIISNCDVLIDPGHTLTNSRRWRK